MIPGTTGLPTDAKQSKATIEIGRNVILAALAGSLVPSLCILGILLALCLPALRGTRVAARRTELQNKLHRIGIALQSYEVAHGCFPPAVVRDKAGMPLYSGRVLLLPFLDQQALFDEFDKNNAWNSPKNQQLTRTSLKAFTNPSSKKLQHGQTDILFVRNGKTIFSGTRQGEYVAVHSVKPALRVLERFVTDWAWMMFSSSRRTCGRAGSMPSGWWGS
jgi:type II secretory pathway pseudopilin PulG